MAVTVDELEVDLRARFDKLGRDLQQAEGRWKSHERSVSTSLKRAAAATAAFVGGVVAVTAAYRTLSSAATRALKEAQGQERAITLLNAQLKTSGQFTEGYSRRLQKLAGDFQRLSTTGDDVTLGLFKQLTAFGANESNIQRLTQATLDLSAGLGTDLNAAVLLVGKALAGEFGSLSRYGIIIDKNASQSEKLDLALRGIEKRFGGSALAATRTFSGALQQLGNNTGDVYEELGLIVTNSPTVRAAINGISDRAAEAASAIGQWREANQELIDQKVGEWANGFAAAIEVVTRAAQTAIPGASNLLSEFAAQWEAIRLAMDGEISFGDVVEASLRNAGSLGGQYGRSDNFQRLIAPLAARPGERRLSGGEVVLGSTEPPPPPAAVPPPGGATGGGGTDRKPADFLADIAKDQAGFLAAAESRLQNQIQLLGDAGDETGQIAALEAQILALRERSLQSQLALAEAQGLSAGEVAQLAAELENAREQIAASTGPAVQVADGFVEATEAARDLGTTLRTDVLGSVKQIVVGIAQGTTDLKDFPSRFAQAASGQIVSRGFDALLGEGGLFGAGTGVGAAGGGVLDKLGSVFGFGASGPGGNAPPTGFTGPPVNSLGATTMGLTGALQSIGAVAGPALAAGGFAAQLAGLFGDTENAIGAGAGAGGGAAAGALIGSVVPGIGTLIGGIAGAIFGGVGGGFLGGLFRDKPTAGEKARPQLRDVFSDANLSGLSPLSKRLPQATLEAEADLIADFFGTDRLEIRNPFSGASLGTRFGLIDGDLRQLNQADLVDKLFAQRFTGDQSRQFGAVAGAAGLDSEKEQTVGIRNLQRRAALFNLSAEQIERENRAAAQSASDLQTEVAELSERFLDFQTLGKGAAIDQGEYNDTLQATVDLFAADLPLGIDASIGALGSLEQFGDQQIANLEDLQETLNDTAQAAQGFAAGISSGLRAAIDSGNIMDVSAALADSFSSTFLDRVVADITESDILGENLTRAVDLQREIASAYREGDFGRATALQGELSQVFADTNARILTETAPIVQSIRGLEASLNVQTSPGIIRQQPIIVQNIVDGRVVSESIVSADRLNRSGGVIVPEQIGTR